MARGDIKIDYDTNDLIFKKSASNIVNKARFYYDVEGVGKIKVEIPESQSLNDLWKSYEAYVDGYIDTSNGIAEEILFVEYFYVSSDDKEIVIDSFPLTLFLNNSRPSLTTISEFRELNDSLVENNESLKIKHYSYDIYSAFEIKVSANTQFFLPKIVQPKDKSLKVNWGDGESDIFFGTVDGFTHTFVGGLLPHTITIEECDFTAITEIVLGDGGALNNGILSVILSRDLVSCSLLDFSFTPDITSIEIPDTMVKLFNLTAINSGVNNIYIPSSLTSLTQILLPNATNLTSLNISRHLESLSFLECNESPLDVVTVNQIMVEASKISSLYFLGLGISASATPDSNSGGNDGITAYWLLVDRGSYIQINSIPPRPENFPVPEIESDFDGVYGQSSVNQPDSQPETSVSVESFVIETVFLGDFDVRDDIQQNEYVLLNINEGSLLQNPTYGVGLGNYLHSPTTDQDLINLVVEKFAQDLLRVTKISKNDGLLSVESEDFNKG